jgi:hypothetical protein
MSEATKTKRYMRLKGHGLDLDPGTTKATPRQRPKRKSSQRAESRESESERERKKRRRRRRAAAAARGGTAAAVDHSTTCHYERKTQVAQAQQHLPSGGRGGGLAGRGSRSVSGAGSDTGRGLRFAQVRYLNHLAAGTQSQVPSKAHVMCNITPGGAPYYRLYESSAESTEWSQAHSAQILLLADHMMSRGFYTHGTYTY